MTPTPQDVEDAKKIIAWFERQDLSFVPAHIARIRSEAEARGRAEAMEEAARLVCGTCANFHVPAVSMKGGYWHTFHRCNASDLWSRAAAERAKLAKSGEGK